MPGDGAIQQPSPEAARSSNFTGVGYTTNSQIDYDGYLWERVYPRIFASATARKKGPAWKIDQDKLLITASPMVTIEVGPEAKLFFVHKTILMRNPFFAACLKGNRFQEGVGGLVKLPEDDPNAMSAFFRFLYTGHLFEENVDDDERPYWIKTTSCLIELYVIADKYLINEMRQEIVGVYKSRLDTTDLNWSHFEAMKAAGLRKTAIWDMLEDVVYDRAPSEPKYGILKKILRDDASAVWAARFRRVPRNYREFMASRQKVDHHEKKA